MKPLFFIAFFFVFISTAEAQDEALRVRAAIDQLFDGMRNNDSVSVKAVLHSPCFLSTVKAGKNGEAATVQIEDIQDFITAVGTPRPGVKLDERLSSYDINVDSDLAVAWTPYRFYVNDKFSHCGVNAFTLVRQNGGWKIVNIIDTRRKDNCIEE